MPLRITNRTRRPRRAVPTALLAIALALLSPTLVLGHAVVYPKSATTGGYERYVLRVPNEKDVATTRVEIQFPAGLRVTSFADVPGWKLEVVTDSAKRIIGAVWTGDLPPQRFVEFPFVAANPKEATTLVWPAYQTYSDGEKVEWTGAAGTKRPASATTIAAAVASAATPAGGASSDTAAGGPTRYVPWVALALGLVSLGLALRRPEGRLAT